MYDEERIVSGDSFEGEDLNEQSLRPQTFDQYIGQKLLIRLAVKARGSEV